jgi:uncharacterized protein (DUF58 family)
LRNFIPFLLLLFIVAAVMRVDFFFTIAYLFFILYVLARLWNRSNLKQVQFHRHFISRAFAGDEVTVKVEVSNNSRLPVPWVQVHESLPVELVSPPFHQEVFSLNPREKRFFSYDLHCRRRGVYRLGPLNIQTGDVLGIEPPRLGEAASDHIIVYPQVVHLPRLSLPTRSPQVALAARSPLFEDPARVVGVRDYQRGDSPRRIHWTATAAAGRLLVKQYQPAIARETLLVLDLNAAAYDPRSRIDATELAIIVAASLAHHISVRQRLPVGLTTEALDGIEGERREFYHPPRAERGHLMNVLETLARAQIGPAVPLYKRLRRERTRLAWGTTVVAITGSANDDLFDGLAVLRQAGFAVSLVLCAGPVATTEARRHAAVLGIPLRQVWRQQDIEQWA